MALTYLKHAHNEAIREAFATLKDKVSRDILNYELSILYRNKIYDQDAELVQNNISLLAENIDHILNEYRDGCLRDIEAVIEQGGYRLSQLLNT